MGPPPPTKGKKRKRRKKKREKGDMKRRCKRLTVEGGSWEEQVQATQAEPGMISAGQLKRKMRGILRGRGRRLRQVRVAREEMPQPCRFRQPERLRSDSPVSLERGARAFFSRMPLQCCSLSPVRLRSAATGNSLPPTAPLQSLTQPPSVLSTSSHLLIAHPTPKLTLHILTCPNQAMKAAGSHLTVERPSRAQEPPSPSPSHRFQ